MSKMFFQLGRQAHHWSVTNGRPTEGQQEPTLALSKTFNRAFMANVGVTAHLSLDKSWRVSTKQPDANKQTNYLKISLNEAQHDKYKIIDPLAKRLDFDNQWQKLISEEEKDDFKYQNNPGYSKLPENLKSAYEAAIQKANGAIASESMTNSSIISLVHPRLYWRALVICALAMQRTPTKYAKYKKNGSAYVRKAAEILLNNKDTPLTLPAFTNPTDYNNEMCFPPGTKPILTKYYYRTEIVYLNQPTSPKNESATNTLSKAEKAALKQVIVDNSFCWTFAKHITHTVTGIPLKYLRLLPIELANKLEPLPISPMKEQNEGCNKKRFYELILRMHNKMVEGNRSSSCINKYDALVALYNIFTKASEPQDASAKDPAAAIKTILTHRHSVPGTALPCSARVLIDLGIITRDEGATPQLWPKKVLLGVSITLLVLGALALLALAATGIGAAVAGISIAATLAGILPVLSGLTATMITGTAIAGGGASLLATGGLIGATCLAKDHNKKVSELPYTLANQPAR